MPKPKPKPKKPKCIYCGHPLKDKTEANVLSTQSPSFGESLSRIRCKKCGKVQTWHEMTEAGKKD